MLEAKQGPLAPAWMKTCDGTYMNSAIVSNEAKDNQERPRQSHLWIKGSSKAFDLLWAEWKLTLAAVCCERNSWDCNSWGIVLWRIVCLKPCMETPFLPTAAWAHRGRARWGLKSKVDVEEDEEGDEVSATRWRTGMDADADADYDADCWCWWRGWVGRR